VLLRYEWLSVIQNALINRATNQIRSALSKDRADDAQAQHTENEGENMLYMGVRKALTSYFSDGSERCLFDVAAYGVSNELLQELPDEILFLLGNRELRPDILGRVEYPLQDKPFYYSRFFVTAEVKDGPPTINDLFQAKKYGEIYEAAISLLVATEKPEERLLRLLKRKSVLLHLPMSMFRVYLCRYSAEVQAFTWWFPEEPRRKEG